MIFALMTAWWRTFMYRCISCVIFLWVTSDGVGIYYRYVLTRGWLLRVDMNLKRLLNGYEGPLFDVCGRAKTWPYEGDVRLDLRAW